MKVFLVALREAEKKDYSDISFEFYVSRRSKFVHMGLDIPLISIVKYREIIAFIKDFWNQNKEGDVFKFCVPRLIAATKYKFDYIIFEKH